MGFNSGFKGLKVFQVFYVHMVYNPALFLASSFCSFLLNVVPNFIFIFLVSRQMVLLSTFPKFNHSIGGPKRGTRPFSEKFNLDCCESFFFLPIFFLRVQISLTYTRMEIASALYNFILENFWTKGCLKVLLEFASFVKYLFHVLGKFHNRNI